MESESNSRTIDNFLIVDNYFTKDGNVTTEFKECDGKILVKHFSGINSENFIVKKSNGKKLEFSFCNINGIYYININGHHMVDYKKFINIQSIITSDNDIKLSNPYMGEILIQNCDVDIIHKALLVMDEWIKSKTKWYSDFLYHFFH